VRASKARLTLLALLFLLSVVAYIDRVCISSAAPDIRKELNIDASQMGWVFGAFALAYAAFEIPSGWLGDRIGARKVLMRIVIWWSAFTMATGLARSYFSLLAIRFLFGAGEAGAYPNASRSIASWFPVCERGRAHGTLFMGSRLGAALTPPLVVFLIDAVGWRHAFWVFGGIGLVWAALWWWWFRDDPATHRSVTAEELAEIRGGTASPTIQPTNWEAIFTSGNLLMIGMQYFCYGYGFYFYITWLPTYLREARGFSQTSAGWAGGGILLVAAMSTVVGGWLTDRLSRRYGLKVGRCVLGSSALAASAFILSAAAITDDARTSILLLAMGAAISELSIGAAWAVCLDIGRSNAGAVTGYMNTLGNLGGAIGPLVMGYAVKYWISWQIPLFITSGIYLLGAIFWLSIRPHRLLQRPDHLNVA